MVAGTVHVLQHIVPTLREAGVAQGKIDAMLIETDAPFLTPVPNRGKPNEPALTADTLRCLAEVKGLDLADLCDTVTATAQRTLTLSCVIITMGNRPAEVIRAIDGPLFITSCVTVRGECDQSDRCNIREPLRKFATSFILENLIKKDLQLFGIRFDGFFSEKTLHEQDRLSAAIRVLEDKGMTALEVLPPPKGVDIDEEEYVAQPLKVVKTTRFGDDRDRPLFKTTGEPTYFAADVAYHFDKISRGYRRLIDVWGADHAGYISRMKAAVAALGGELEVIIFQLVNLMKDGQPFRMSKRAANFVTLRELLETVPALPHDVALDYVLTETHLFDFRSL